MTTPYMVGETVTINGRTLHIVECDRHGYCDAVDEHGQVWQGTPSMGLSMERGLVIPVPAVPPEDSSDSAWDAWAAECSRLIANRR